MHIATALVDTLFEVIGIIWNHLSNAMNHPRIPVNLDFLNITFSCFLFGYVFLLFLETSFCIKGEEKSPRLILSLLNQTLFSNICYDSWKRRTRPDYELFVIAFRHIDLFQQLEGSQ